MDQLKAINAYVEDFVSHLDLPVPVTIVTSFDESADLYQILLQTSDPALLIGYHGETLSSLQLILGQHLHAKFDQWFNLSLNINDYRERRENTLHALADTAVAQVLATSQPHSLPAMPASERRLIHMYLAENTKVTTASDGVGRSRSVIISPK